MKLGLSLGLGGQNGAAGNPPFVPADFPLSTAKFNGDSRTQATGGRTVSSGSLIVGAGFGGVQSMGLVQALSGNKFLLREGYQHAIGGSTSLAHEERDQSNSILLTGNPANAVTSIAADAQFSSLSDGLTTALTQDGNHVFSFSVGVNDNSGTAATYYNSPSTASQTLAAIAAIADAYGVAGKVWYLGNEAPRGNSYWQMESRSVTSGTCTASRTTDFIDGETFGAVGVVGVFASGDPRPLTKVASAPGQDEYTVTSGGVYTFGGTAPTTVFINYNASPSGAGPNATYDQLRIVNEFCNSSAANFVSTINDVDYGIPGLRYQRPWVRIVDTFGTLVDPDSGASQLALPGTADNLQLHGVGKHSYLVGAAFAALLNADYADAPDLSAKPTRNNWDAARGNGVSTTRTGTLPPTMRVGFTGTPAPTLITINGVPVGKVDTSTGAITGTDISSGSLNYTTGEWTITWTVAPVNAGRIWFEQDVGNFDFDTMTEGTIKRNAQFNGLLDMTPAVGDGISTTTGTSSVSGVTNSQIPYGWTFTNAALNTAVINGTVRVTILTGTDADGYPYWGADFDGIHTADIVPALTNGSLQLPAARFTAGDLINVGGQIAYGKHGTIARRYGASGGQVLLNIGTASVSRNSNTGPQNVTQLATRVTDGTPGLYLPEELVDEAGGEFNAYRLAPLLETTGATFGTTTLQINMERFTANIPFAARVLFGRLQARGRTDVS